jgi:hypothetical protein
MPIADQQQTMSQHAVPQNVMDVEFKLIGEMTLRQFAYLMVCALIAYVCYLSLIGIFKWPAVIFFLLLGVGLAFVPIQDRGLDIWFVNFLNAMFMPTQRVWQKAPIIPQAFLYQSLDVVKHEMITLAPTSSRRKLEKFLDNDIVQTDVDPLDIPIDAYVTKVRSAFASGTSPAAAVGVAVRAASPRATVPVPSSPVVIPSKVPLPPPPPVPSLSAKPAVIKASTPAIRPAQDLKAVPETSQVSFTATAPEKSFVARMNHATAVRKDAGSAEGNVNGVGPASPGGISPTKPAKREVPLSKPTISSPQHKNSNYKKFQEVVEGSPKPDAPVTSASSKTVYLEPVASPSPDTDKLPAKGGSTQGSGGGGTLPPPIPPKVVNAPATTQTAGAPPSSEVSKPTAPVPSPVKTPKPSTTQPFAEAPQELLLSRKSTQDYMPFDPISRDRHSGRRFTSLLPQQGEILLPIRGERVLNTPAAQEVENDIKEKTEQLQALLEQLSQEDFSDTVVSTAVEEGATVGGSPIPSKENASREEKQESMNQARKSAKDAVDKLKDENAELTEELDKLRADLSQAHRKDSQQKVPVSSVTKKAVTPESRQPHKDRDNKASAEYKNLQGQIKDLQGKIAQLQNSGGNSDRLAEAAVPEAPLAYKPAAKFLTDKPNVLSGVVSDAQGTVLEGMLLIVKDPKGDPVRAFKTNRLGEFVLANPLDKGTYTVEVSSVNETKLVFDIISVEAKGEVIPPVELIGS